MSDPKLNQQQPASQVKEAGQADSDGVQREQQVIGAGDVGDLSSVLGDKTTGTIDLAATEKVVSGGITTPLDVTTTPVEEAGGGIQMLDPKVAAAQQDQSAQASKVAEVTGANTSADTPVVEKEDDIVLEEDKVEDAPEVDIVAKAKEVVNSKTKAALRNLETYVDEMRPGRPQNPESILRHQISLLAALNTVVTNEDVHFPVAFQAVIKIVRDNKDLAFKATARNRGLNAAPLSKIDQKNMRFLTRMIDLLVITAGINNREDVKSHVDLAKVIETVTSVRGRQNLTAFYSS